MLTNQYVNPTEVEEKMSTYVLEIYEKMKKMKKIEEK